MPQPHDKTDRLAALTNGGGDKPGKTTANTTASKSGKSVHHILPNPTKLPSASKLPKPGPLPVHRYRGATAAANEANGYKEFRVVAPRDKEGIAVVPDPNAKEKGEKNEDGEIETIVVVTGPESIEYAPPHAIPGRVERIPFDPARIGEETRRINEDAERDAEASAINYTALIADLAELAAETEARNAALDAKKREKRDEQKPRRDMGDFADDEDGLPFIARRVHSKVHKR